MKRVTNKNNDNLYRACRSVVGEEAWECFSKQWAIAIASHSLSTALPRKNSRSIPKFLPDLARLEETTFSASEKKGSIPNEVDRPRVNPTIQIIELSWKNLTTFLDPDQNCSTILPQRLNERILVFYHPRAGRVIARPATDEDLLVLKMIVEGISPETVAEPGKLPIGAVDRAFFRASAGGLVLTPPSRIRRDPAVFHSNNGIPGQYFSSPSFTLQWHITQACDLHCKHCYDRSDRTPMTLDQAVHILDDLRAFCKSRNVSGAVSFTGGNPLLHPAFTEIYRAAAERGFTAAILGNPASRARIEELIAIQMPAFFQVSLEGLREHNDSIRGPGHFDRILAFLDVLQELRASSMVMLTLTSENIDQVLLLAELLRGKADTFHFNRLSMVGEGANLTLPDARHYRAFLQSYLDAARTNPVMGIKDNLINIIRREQGREPFGGCTGYGCGAAFNFVTLLADGEVHACRKFPSPIGTINQLSIAEIYDAEPARRYRAGASACQTCPIRPVCGGCLASTNSHGLNVFEDKDPFCFMHDRVPSG
ncbi:MAG: thio(seleno)oxazole modification radical SAM maturase SbtM [Nitrospirae bacterium]|nr:thio(seleno)oxazole modification radical SAM maturase SbtM [Nitrospirota bacterium]